MPLGSYIRHWEEEMPTVKYRPQRKGENQLTLSFLPAVAAVATTTTAIVPGGSGALPLVLPEFPAGGLRGLLVSGTNTSAVPNLCAC